VLVGAGISVSCGIPDFRSKGTGLYNTLNYQELGLSNPEDLFDIETFQDDPRPFYRFAYSLYPGKIDPGPSHKFLARLDQQNMLLRVYTQNIDGLEQSAGVAETKVIYAHGSLLHASCMKCKARYLADDIALDVRAGTVPLCERRLAKKSKKTTEQSTSSCRGEHRTCLRRSSRTSSKKSNHQYKILPKECCGGVIKPNVTFFGEKLANNIGQSLEKDYKKADALIVMGTSLSVAPMSKVVEFMPPNILRVLVNRNIVSAPNSSKKHHDSTGKSCLFDACLLGNCDDVVHALKKKMIESEFEVSAGAQYFDKATISQIPFGVIPGESAGEWLQNQPVESVLLFPGALPYSLQEQDNDNLTIHVHCDECRKEIGGLVYSCETCFDFDLCSDCFPKLSKTHADGKHNFKKDRPMS